MEINSHLLEKQSGKMSVVLAGRVGQHPGQKKYSHLEQHRKRNFIKYIDVYFLFKFVYLIAGL